MLDPNDRQHLFAALAPPSGYQLDHAIGTTFTLDLLAAVTVPLAFSLFSGETDDPLAMLQALQANAERVTIFCQAGRISIPATYQPMFGFLESRIMQVAAPKKNGVFHPKVWALRYVATGAPVRYRLLVASRNLTFDRSWDTLLCLDGKLLERKRAFGKNRPISDFITTLATLATQPVPNPAIIAQIADEVRRVQFTLPSGFDDIDFYPIGYTGRKSWPFDVQTDGPSRRLLVISPFLAASTLKRLTHQVTHGTTLITRLNEVMKFSAEQLSPVDQVFTLDSAAELDEEESSELTGLHAKLFLLEHGRRLKRATLWTGSANATNAAFGNNVEFLVALHGDRKHIGIDRLLPSDMENGIGKLLMPFEPAEADAEESLREELDEQLEQVQRELAAVAWQADVEACADEWALRLSGNVAALPDGIVLGIRPISLQESYTRHFLEVPRFEEVEPLIWSPISFTALTSFFAFTLSIKVDKTKVNRYFVLNVPLLNAPENRQAHIVRNLLSDSNAVLRYLRLLLADSPLALLSADAWTTSETVGSDGTGVLGSAELFESLVKALAQQPDRLPAIARIIDILQDTPDRLPLDLLTIWKPIWQAYCEIYDADENVKRKA